MVPPPNQHHSERSNRWIVRFVPSEPGTIGQGEHRPWRFWCAEFPYVSMESPAVSSDAALIPKKLVQKRQSQLGRPTSVAGRSTTRLQKRETELTMIWTQRDKDLATKTIESAFLPRTSTKCSLVWGPQLFL